MFGWEAVVASALAKAMMAKRSIEPRRSHKPHVLGMHCASMHFTCCVHLCAVEVGRFRIASQCAGLLPHTRAEFGRCLRLR